MAAQQSAHPNGAVSDRRSPSWGGMLFRVFVTIAVLPILGTIVTGLLAWLVHLWDLPVWLLYVIGSILTIGGVAAVWFWMRALARRRYQFSIRSMLIGMAVVALFCGVLGRRFHRAWKQQRAVSHLTASGGGVKAWWETADGNLLNRQFGHDPFRTVFEVRIRGDGAVSALLEHRDEFADLETLSFCGAVTDSGLKQVGGLNDFSKLRTADISGTTITDAGLKHLGQWTNLEELCLNGCSRITDDGLAHLQNLPNLEALMLVADGKRKMPLSAAGFAHLKDMSGLKMLYLIGLPVGDGGLAHLEKMSQLRTLVIDNLPVSDAGFVHLGNMSQLEMLLIWRLPASDAGLVHIGKMSQLRRLSVSRMPVTDAGLMHLRGMTNLRRLSIDRCKVTDDGSKRLCEALPNCWVTMDDVYFPRLEQIAGISVTDLRGLKKPTVTISEPDRIAAIKSVFEETCSFSGWKGLPDPRPAANIRVDFEGPNRRFCQVLLGDGILQLNGDDRWSQRPIADDQTARLTELLGFDTEKRSGGR